MMSSAWAISMCVLGVKSNLASSPQRRTSLFFSAPPTGTEGCGRLGMPMRISLICAWTFLTLGSRASILCAIVFIDAIFFLGSFFSFRARLISSLAAFFWPRNSSSCVKSLRRSVSYLRTGPKSMAAPLACRPFSTVCRSSRINLISNMVPVRYGQEMVNAVYVWRSRNHSMSGGKTFFENRLDLRGQQLGPDRLAKIIVDAQVKAVNDRLGRIDTGQKHDRDGLGRFIILEQPAHGDTIHLGHAAVRENQIRQLGPGDFIPFRAIDGGNGAVAQFLNSFLD